MRDVDMGKVTRRGMFVICHPPDGSARFQLGMQVVARITSKGSRRREIAKKKLLVHTAARHIYISCEWEFLLHTLQQRCVTMVQCGTSTAHQSRVRIMRSLD